MTVLKESLINDEVIANEETAYNDFMQTLFNARYEIDNPSSPSMWHIVRHRIYFSLSDQNNLKECEKFEDFQMAMEEIAEKQSLNFLTWKRPALGLSSFTSRGRSAPPNQLKFWSMTGFTVNMCVDSISHCNNEQERKEALKELVNKRVSLIIEKFPDAAQHLNQQQISDPNDKDFYGAGKSIGNLTSDEYMQIILSLTRYEIALTQNYDKAETFLAKIKTHRFGTNIIPSTYGMDYATRAHLAVQKENAEESRNVFFIAQKYPDPLSENEYIGRLIVRPPCPPLFKSPLDDLFSACSSSESEGTSKNKLTKIAEAYSQYILSNTIERGSSHNVLMRVLPISVCD